MGSNIPYSASGQKLTAPFTPTQIPGCQVWLDAADTRSYTLSGTNLTSWSDKSGTGKTFSFSGTPTYKANALATLPTVVFNTTMLTTTFGSSIGSGDVAYFAVWIQYTNNSGILMSLGGTSTPALGLGCNGKYNLFEWGGPESDYNFTASISYNQYVIQTGTIRSNAMLCSVNGYTGTNATSTQSQTSTTFTIGSSSSVGSGYKINGEVAEILVYVGTVSTAQQQQIEGYLAWKWGLQGSLNPSHPYATVNPDPPIYPVVPYPFLSYVKSSPEFDPRLIPGCVLWLDGQDLTTLFQNTSGTTPVTTAGQVVQLWKDKSSTANDASSSSSSMTYVQNSIYFPGSQTTGLSLSASQLPNGTSDSTWFFVINTTTTATVVFFAAGSSGSSLRQFYLAGGNLQADESGVAGISGTTAANTGSNVIFSCLESQSTTTLTGWQNGAQFATKTFTFNIGTTAATIGTDIGSFIYTGYVSEILCFNTSVSATQRQQVEAYLAKKWKVSALSTQNIYAPGSYLTFVNAPIVPVLPMRRAVQTNKFLPTQIGGLQLWLDAADLTTMTLSGSNLTRWNDKSGLGNHVLNSYISGTITYSARTLSTDGSSYFYAPVDSRRSTVANLQVFIVYKWLDSTSGTNQGLWGDDDGGWQRLQLLSFSNNTPEAYGLSKGYTGGYPNAATSTTSSNIMGTSNTIIYQASYTGYTTNGSGVYLNGLTSVTFTDTTPSPQTSLTNTWFSAIGPNNDIPAKITFSEILMYNTTITDGQRQQLEGYFAWKWGLKSNIGAGHPFFLIPPLPLP